MILLGLSECGSPPAWSLLEEAGFEVHGAEWEREDRADHLDDYGDCVLAVSGNGVPLHAVISPFPYDAFRVLPRGAIPAWATMTAAMLRMELS